MLPLIFESFGFYSDVKCKDSSAFLFVLAFVYTFL